VTHLAQKHKGFSMNLSKCFKVKYGKDGCNLTTKELSMTHGEDSRLGLREDLGNLLNYRKIKLF
jgi:hypothetical protein